MTVEHFVAVEGAGVGQAALLSARGDLEPSFFLCQGEQCRGKWGFPIINHHKPHGNPSPPPAGNGQTADLGLPLGAAARMGCSRGPHPWERRLWKALIRTPKGRHMSWRMRKARPAHPFN